MEAGKLMFDLYSELGVDRDASQEEITNAFRNKSKVLHPDTGKGNLEDFKNLSRAYSVLKAPEKRKIYDKTGDEKAASKTNPLITSAIERLLLLLSKLIDEDPNIINKDIITILTSNIEKIAPEGKKEIAKLNNKIEALKALRDNFKFKKKKKVIEADIIKNMFDDKIRNIQNNIDQIQTEIDIAKIALNILKCYQYKRNGSFNGFSVMYQSTTSNSTYY